MKTFISTLLAIFLGAYSISVGAPPEINKMQKEMLDPAVQVKNSSGTIIYDPDGKYVYILTASHVVQEFIDTKNYGGGTRVEVRSPVPVRFFIDNEEESVKKGRIIEVSNYYDLALLEIENENPVSVASILDKDYELNVFEKSWSIGSGLGDYPFPTTGLISDINYTINWKNLPGIILSTASITWGNSGGGLYVYNEEDGKYELAGVNIALRETPRTLSRPPYPMTHMAMAVSYKEVISFLNRSGWGQIVGTE